MNKPKQMRNLNMLLLCYTNGICGSLGLSPQFLMYAHHQMVCKAPINIFAINIEWCSYRFTWCIVVNVGYKIPDSGERRLAESCGTKWNGWKKIKEISKPFNCHQKGLFSSYLKSSAFMDQFVSHVQRFDMCQMSKRIKALKLTHLRIYGRYLRFSPKNWSRFAITQQLPVALQCFMAQTGTTQAPTGP